MYALQYIAIKCNARQYIWFNIGYNTQYNAICVRAQTVICIYNETMGRGYAPARTLIQIKQ